MKLSGTIPAYFLLASALVFAEGKASAPTRLPVAVMERTPPLEPTKFEAFVDGEKSRILAVRGPKEDLILLLVLDLTGDLNLVDAARNALVEQLGTLEKNQWVAVFKSQDLLQVLADPGPDRKATAESIRSYVSTGKAGLLTTIEEAAALGDTMLARTPVRVAVVYVTDSNIYNYREDFTNPVINSSDSRDLSRKFPDQLIREKLQKLSATLSGSQTPLFIVQLGDFSDPINEAYRRGLMQLATESGGTAGFCRSPGDIPWQVSRIVEAAASHWSVQVALPPNPPKSVILELLNGERSLPSRARFQLRK